MASPEAFLSLILDGIPQSVWVVDEAGVILFYAGLTRRTTRLPARVHSGPARTCHAACGSRTPARRRRASTSCSSAGTAWGGPTIVSAAMSPIVMRE